MGIEPTSRTFNMRLNDFEDRGHHQVCKHFRKVCASTVVQSPGAHNTPQQAKPHRTEH